MCVHMTGVSGHEETGTSIITNSAQRALSGRAGVIGLFHINLSALRTGISLSRGDEAGPKEARFQMCFQDVFSLSHIWRDRERERVREQKRFDKWKGKNDIQEHRKLSGCARHTSFNKAFEKARNANSRRCTNASILYSLTVYDAMCFGIFINIAIWTCVTYFHSVLVHLGEPLKKKKSPWGFFVTLGLIF